MPELPFEIANAISGLVADSANSIRDLQACSATCRLWNAAGRPFLFRSITINSEARLQAFVKCLESRPEIKHWVRRFRIDGREYKRLHQSWVFNVFETLNSYDPFPRVEALELLGLFEAPEYSGNTNVFSKMGWFAPIRTLRILETGLPQPLLRSYACSFPELEDLVITRTKTSVWGLHDPIKNPNLALTSFTFRDDFGETDYAILTWIASTKSRETIRILDIEAVQQRNYGYALMLVTHLAPLLRELSLGRAVVYEMETPFAQPEVPRHPFPLTELRKLTIQTAPKQRYNKIFESLPSPELLLVLTFVLAPMGHVEFRGPAGSLEISAFEEIPITRFTNLEEVIFECPPEQEHRDVARVCVEALKKKHPELAKKEGFFKLVFT